MDLKQLERTPNTKVGDADQTEASQTWARRISGGIQQQHESEWDEEDLHISDQVKVGNADDLHGGQTPETPQSEVLDDNGAIGECKAIEEEPQLQVTFGSVWSASAAIMDFEHEQTTQQTGGAGGLRTKQTR